MPVYRRLGGAWKPLQGFTPPSNTGQLAAASAVVSALSADVPVSRPTGPGYLAFEDLYSPGMGDSTLALQQVINKITDGSILTMPAGVWTIGTSGWQGNNGGSFAGGKPFAPALLIPKGCGGIWGSGRGSLGSSSGTVIRLAVNSSINPNVAGAAVYGGGSGSSPITLKYLHFEGTSQGRQTGSAGKNGEDGVSEKLYTMVYLTGTKVLVEQVFINGNYGNNGSPPGETFGLQIYNTPAGASNHVVRDFEFDGRRTVGGLSYGAVGVTSGTCNGWTWDRVKCHHSNVTANAVLYQAMNGTSTDLAIGSPSDNDGTSQFGKKGGGLNHERTTGNVHIRPNLWVPSDGKKIHVWHSTDAYKLGSVDTTNGTLRLTDPTYNNVWGDNRLYIETWGPAYGPDANWGSTETIHNAPYVTLNGADLPYKWARQGTQYVATSNQYVA